MVISARNVTLTLGSASAATAILKGIDLDIARGSSVALLGPSGSGKSSLMAVLSGLEQASGGEVEVAGLDFGALDEDALARARRGRIGIVLQAFHLLPTMTALENVAVPMELAGMADAFARAADELEAVGLGHRTGHYPTQLSGGEQQRVAIARALVAAPALIFADEPTGNLDTKTSTEIMDLITRLNRDNGITVIMVTHEEDIAAYGSRLLRFTDGHLVSDEPNLERASHAAGSR